MVICGENDFLGWLQQKISSVYLCKIRGLLGRDTSDNKGMVIVNRIVNWSDKGITLEADPRHVELKLQELGLEKCKGSQIMVSSAKPRRRGITERRRSNSVQIDRCGTQFLGTG